MGWILTVVGQGVVVWFLPWAITDWKLWLVIAGCALMCRGSYIWGEQDATT